MRVVLLALVLVVGCDSALSGDGGPCSTSEECAPGLICDFGRVPHVCATMSSTSTDLSAVGDAGYDAGTD